MRLLVPWWSPPPQQRKVYQLLLLAACYCAHGVGALRHTFIAHKDHSLVGPIGVPFGFLERGHFDLSVEDFEMSMSPAAKDLADEADQILFQAEAGFVLKKFKNEAAFTTYMDTLRTNVSLCAFEMTGTDSDTGDDTMPRRTDDYGDGDDYVGPGLISSADEIVLHLNSRRDSGDMEYTFKRYDFELAGRWPSCARGANPKSLSHGFHFAYHSVEYPTSCFVQWRRGTLLFDV
jgi:hypothetical protein